MRTTLTLDADVAAKLKATARRTGRPFKEVVNDALRKGLLTDKAERRAPFRIATRSLGGVRPGVRIDDIAGLLEQVEGPQHR